MFSKSFTFCFIVLLFAIFAHESHSLQEGDVGTCRGRVSSVATKSVPYIGTGYCRGSRKICRMRKWRTVRYMKWRMGTICCEGWQHNDDLDACKPICSTGCLNGTCVAPEKCQCSPPMYLDPSRKYICLSPVCDPPCINSICVNKQMQDNEYETTTSGHQPNGICECLNNTRRYNETHCAYCDENYKINSDLTCTAECSRLCVNGECIAPNKCRCLEGYTYKDDFTCEFQCHQCVNGKCIGPDKCKCLPGFVAVNVTHCVRCDCENGECVSGVCVCRDGYTLVDGVCEPVCGPCVNGICSAPGVCTCFEDHTRSADPGVCCRPECGKVCDSNGECPSVACVPRIRVKIPNCIPNPPRRRCTQVLSQEQMICCNHWKYIAKEEKCEPICKSGCVNGECIAPDTCTCLPGFVEQNDTTCVPNCENPCIKGVCSAPNKCTCDLHYQLDPTDKFNCLPICETQCVNASCVSPNTCLCDPGYEPENSWQCKPVCDSCQNGECIAPNNCRCNDGYSMKDGQCTPVCDQPCLNGHCSMPNVCTCHDGFKLNPLNSFSCEPICDPECVNSKCTSPNTCSCFEGFELENDRRCKPVCDSCENGKCIAPNNCSCNEGYKMQDGRCTPVCNNPCQNGFCSTPNVCSCHEGFKRNSVNKFICEPICEPKCENSTCVSPNKCICNPGYEPEDKRRCRPVCEGCEHGVCIAPNKCSCIDGYAMQDSRCAPVCEIPCVNGRCVKPNECECFKGFKLNKMTLTCDPVCEPGCVKSKCVAPNKCLCLDGHEETSKPFVCKPTCESCENGLCVAPGRCNCNEGYKMGGKKCSPICSEACENGYCSSPNICSCLDGFVKKDDHQNICYKACDGPCENGYCNEYGMCECHTGFEMYNVTCLPSPQVDCDSCESNCTTDGNCRCNNGTHCYVSLRPSSEEITTSASLAGLEWSWMLGGAVGLLLIALLLVVIQRTWARRQMSSEKPVDQRNDMYTSVVYSAVVPNTLINSKIPEDGEPQDGYYDEVAKEPETEVQDSLLGTRVEIEDEHL